jgi:penicillin-binding protein 2
MALFSKEVRLQLLALFVVLAVGGLVVRLWWVQVVKSDQYAQRIRGGSTVSVRIPSVRGEIRDRNGVTLVGNRASYQLEFYLPDMVNGYRRTLGPRPMPVIPATHTVRGMLQDTKEVDVVRIVNDVVQPQLTQLGIRQDYNADRLQKHFRNNTQVPYTFVEDLKFADMAKLSERNLGLPGVNVSPRPVRQYYYGALAAHLLGYVGPEDTDLEEAKRYNFYQADVSGKSNIELTMDRYLRGKPGVRVLKRDVKGVVEGAADSGLERVPDDRRAHSIHR